MERVYIDRECGIAYTVMALHSFYNVANDEISIDEIVEEIKAMFIYTDEVELMKRMDKVLEEEGKNKIKFCKDEQKIGITIEECARYMGVSKQLMSEIVREPNFPCIKFKRRILINKSKVQEWFDNNVGKRIRY